MMATDESSQGDPRPHPLSQELSRLSALLRYEILDTPSEEEFDDFTRLAAFICGTPIALISLVDERRQWFKSRVGLSATETPRQIAFCSHAIQGQSLFEVDDALKDLRFRDNPLVTGEPKIRFYAGAPLTTPDGHNLGTLCVIDREPRQLNDEQRDALARLSRQVIRLFEQRLLTRQHAEQAILQQVMLDSAGSAILVMSAEGRIQQANPTAQALLGHSETSLIGQLASSLFPPSALAARATELSAELGEPVSPDFAVFSAPLRHGHREQRPWRLRHRSGREVPVLLSVSSIPGPDQRPRGYLAIAYDLTAQQALQLRFQQIAAQVPGMLFQYRWHPLEGGRFTFVSEGIEAVFGLSPQRVIDDGEDLFLRIHPEDRAAVQERVHQATLASQPWHFEHRAEHPDKGLLWLECRASPLPQEDGALLWHGLVTDISARKAQQHELEKQQELTRLLIESLSEAVVACDREGRLILSNHQARAWFGQLPDNLSEWLEHLAVFDSEGKRPEPAARLPLVRALQGEVVAEAEHTVLLGDQARHLLTSADPLFGSDARQLGAVAVMHDITERKRIERLQRDFVSMVSHELRTPLTSITGSLALICDGVMGSVPTEIAELLEIALHNSERLGALIDDLLDLDKINAGEMRVEPCRQPLQPLLEQALRNNRGYAERHAVQLHLCEHTEAEVCVDALRLHQVLNNLLSNAAKFSPSGATVQLHIRQTEGWVRVEVCDQGPGIPAAFQPRVFQKFAQADPSPARGQGGTGLGLAISKALIEQMGGRIGYDSPAQGGTCFWFELPLGEGAAA